MDLKITKVLPDGTVSLAFDSQPKRVSGIDLLAQQVIVELISDYNLYLNRGAGLQRLVEVASPAETEKTRANIRLAVSSAKSHIIAAQQEDNLVLPAERLQDLRIIRLSTQSGIDWAIDIEIINILNESTSTTLNI